MDPPQYRPRRPQYYNHHLSGGAASGSGGRSRYDPSARFHHQTQFPHHIPSNYHRPPAPISSPPPQLPHRQNSDSSYLPRAPTPLPRFTTDYQSQPLQQRLHRPPHSPFAGAAAGPSAPRVEYDARDAAPHRYEPPEWQRLDVVYHGQQTHERMQPPFRRRQPDREFAAGWKGPRIGQPFEEKEFNFNASRRDDATFVDHNTVPFNERTIFRPRFHKQNIGENSQNWHCYNNQGKRKRYPMASNQNQQRYSRVSVWSRIEENPSVRRSPSLPSVELMPPAYFNDPEARAENFSVSGEAVNSVAEFVVMPEMYDRSFDVNEKNPVMIQGKKMYMEMSDEIYEKSFDVNEKSPLMSQQGRQKYLGMPGETYENISDANAKSPSMVQQGNNKYLGVPDDMYEQSFNVNEKSPVMWQQGRKSYVGMSREIYERSFDVNEKSPMMRQQGKKKCTDVPEEIYDKVFDASEKSPAMVLQGKKKYVGMHEEASVRSFDINEKNPTMVQYGQKKSAGTSQEIYEKSSDVDENSPALMLPNKKNGKKIVKKPVKVATADLTGILGTAAKDVTTDDLNATSTSIDLDKGKESKMAIESSGQATVAKTPAKKRRKTATVKVKVPSRKRDAGTSSTEKASVKQSGSGLCSVKLENIDLNLEASMEEGEIVVLSSEQNEPALDLCLSASKSDKISDNLQKEASATSAILYKLYDNSAQRDMSSFWEPRIGGTEDIEDARGESKTPCEKTDAFENVIVGGSINDETEEGEINMSSSENNFDVGLVETNLSISELPGCSNSLSEPKMEKNSQSKAGLQNSSTCVAVENADNDNHLFSRNVEIGNMSFPDNDSVVSSFSHPLCRDTEMDSNQEIALKTSSLSVARNDNSEDLELLDSGNMIDTETRPADEVSCFILEDRVELEFSTKDFISDGALNANLPLDSSSTPRHEAVVRERDGFTGGLSCALGISGSHVSTPNSSNARKRKECQKTDDLIISEEFAYVDQEAIIVGDGLGMQGANNLDSDCVLKGEDYTAGQGSDNIVGQSERHTPRNECKNIFDAEEFITSCLEPTKNLQVQKPHSENEPTDNVQVQKQHSENTSSLGDKPTLLGDSAKSPLVDVPIDKPELNISVVNSPDTMVVELPVPCLSDNIGEGEDEKDDITIDAHQEDSKVSAMVFEAKSTECLLPSSLPMRQTYSSSDLLEKVTSHPRFTSLERTSSSSFSAPKGLPGRMNLLVKSSMVNQKVRNKTWLRGESNVYSALGLQGNNGNSNISAKPSPRRQGKIQSSYIRKGNALIRNPAIGQPPPPPRIVNAASSNVNRNVTRCNINSGTVESSENAAQLNPLFERPVTPIHLHQTMSTSSTDEHLDMSSQTLPGKNMGTEVSAEVLVTVGLPCFGDDPYTKGLKKSEMDMNKVMYVKSKSSQLVATVTSNAGNSTNSTLEKIPILPPNASSELYYKKKKNQIVLNATSDGQNINDECHCENAKSDHCYLLPKSGALFRNKLHRALQKPKGRKFSCVWTLSGQSKKRSMVASSHMKLLPQFLPWKRKRQWIATRRNRRSMQNNSSLSIMRKVLSRKSDTIYTVSNDGFSLRKTSVQSLGWSRLKWSRCSVDHPKEVNEESVPAFSEVDKLKSDKQPLPRSNDGKPAEGSFLNADNNHSRNSTLTVLRVPSPCDEYMRLSNGNKLVRKPKKVTRMLAIEKVRWSLHTVRSRKAKKQQYCQFFTRFGYCSKRDSTCPYIHDPAKVTICTKFLKGLCSNARCMLTHKVLPERMPDCSFFLRGLCTNVTCPYRHVKVNQNAAVCEAFLKGYCPAGDECRKKHNFVCPAFESNGECLQGTKCKLHHPRKKARPGDKKAATSDSNNTIMRRYFNSIAGNNGGPFAACTVDQDSSQPVGEGGEEFGDFVSLSYSAEEDDGIDDALEDIRLLQLDLNALEQKDNLDALIKPLRIMRTARVMRSLAATVDSNLLQSEACPVAMH